MIKNISYLFICCLFICFMLNGSVFGQTTIYVDASATGADDGSSWEDAYDTIQEGLNDAVSNDTVLVAAGTYTGAGNVTLDFGAAPNDFTLECNSTGECIIDGEEESVRGWIAYQGETNDSVFKGFVVQWCDISGSGGGCGISGVSPTVKQCWFKDCEPTADGGGAWVSNAGANPIFISCIFSGNVLDAAKKGGGVYIAATAAGATFKNCTIFGNSVGIFGDFSGLGSEVAITVTNCIIYGNTGDISDENKIPATPTYSLYDYAETSGDTPGAGCLDGGSVDPLFYNETEGDFHLLTGSPCIHAGTPLSISTDFDGQPYGATTPSRGVYEYAGHGQSQTNGLTLTTNQ